MGTTWLSNPDPYIPAEPLKNPLHFPDVFRSRAFLNFLENLKQCLSVKAIYVIGGMAYRGWSDKDLDLWIETYDGGCPHLNSVLNKYPWKFNKKDDCGYRHVGKIPVDIWLGRDNERESLDLDRPFIVLWSRT